MTLRWPAHRTSQPKVPCTWGFLTNMLVMAPWPVFTCLGFVSVSLRGSYRFWFVGLRALPGSGACAVRSVFLEQRPSAPCTRSLGWGRGRTCWEETCSLELQAEHEMRGGMGCGGSRREGLPAEVRAGGGAGRPSHGGPGSVRSSVWHRHRGGRSAGRAVSCVRAGTWLPALRTPSRLPPPQSPGGRSALRLFVGVKKCRCRDFRNVVGDSDFRRSLFLRAPQASPCTPARPSCSAASTITKLFPLCGAPASPETWTAPPRGSTTRTPSPTRPW